LKPNILSNTGQSKESEMNWQVRHGERRKPYKENPMSDLNKSPQELQTEIEALREKVAGLTQERDGWINEADHYREQLAAVTQALLPRAWSRSDELRWANSLK
jgi:FtsZ-binding cell division protein ZapB